MKTRSTQRLFQKIQLKNDQALVLSNHQQLSFPNASQIRQNIFSSIVSYVKKPNTKAQTKSKCFLPIPDQMIVMTYGNKINLYRYQQIQNQQLKVQLLFQLQLNYNIKKIKISPYMKYNKDKHFHLLVQDSSSNYLQLLLYDAGEKVIKRIKYQKLPSQINCWSFIQNNQILIWCSNMKLYHYQIKNTGINYIQVIETGINLIQEIKPPDQKLEGLSKGKIQARSKSKNQENVKNKPITKDKEEPIPNGCNFTLNHCEIIGRRGKEQDSLIVLFYILYNQQLNGMKIRCKQILYPFQNQIQQTYTPFFHHSKQYTKLKVFPQNYQIICNNAANPIALQTLSISQIDDVFLIRFQFEILVIQKKFNQYLAMDSIYKKTKDCSMSVAFNSNIITCTSNKILQLNQITVTQNKLITNMMDFIDLQREFQIFKQSARSQPKVKVKSKKSQNKISGEEQVQISLNFSEEVNNFFEVRKRSRLFCMWVSPSILNQQERNIVYIVFQLSTIQNNVQKKQYYMYLTKIVPKIKKLTNLAHNSRVQDLQNIQKLGQSLGIKSSQFYYNMWRTSIQSIDQIMLYLLQCKNYKIIINQLRGFLRKRSYATTRLFKIVEKLKSLTLQILKTQLTEENLVNYYRSVFTHRKFQIYQSNYQMDDNQFSAVLQSSLYQFFKKIINSKLYPEVIKSQLWSVKSKQPPKMNMIQILDLFKLPLLEQYDKFLQNVLQSFPDDIIRVIEQFPQILPEYPFQQYTVVPKNETISETNLKQLQTKRQNQFFSPVKYNDLINSPDFLQHTLKQLHPYYQTSFIIKTLNQTSKRYEVLNQKFVTHIMIETSYEKYINKLKNIAGQKLYIVTLQSLIKCNYKKNVTSQSNIDKLCQIFKNNNGVTQEVAQQLRIIACFYQLMIYHQIIDIKRVSLQSIFTEPIEKWIALFFLGNKQQKDLIFNQFMKIYRNKETFVKTLMKFIASEHCSKIQLSFLIDLINHAGPQFQRQNQSVIEVIIDGFCSKIQVSDTPDANHFKQRMRTIHMGEQLLIKADKIQKLALCKRILSIFYLQSTIVKDLFDKPLQIMQKMLQSFFMGNIKQSKVAIAQKKILQIQLKEIKNMFQLIKFLRQNILFNVSAEDLVILYCKKLIEWQQFDEVQQFIYKEDYLQVYNLNTEYIVNKIQNQILQTLYDNNELYYNAETRIFISNILNLAKVNIINGVQSQNILVLQQRAKMKIVEIFQKWGFQIRLTLLNSIVKKWEDLEEQSNRQAAFGGVFCRPIMNQIIQIYAQFLDAESLQQIYRQFMIISSCRQDPIIKTDQFYHYCTKLGDSLMGLQRLKQTSEIICIVNERFQMNYFLMVQCMLKSLIRIYLKKQNNQMQIFSKGQAHQSFHLDTPIKKNLKLNKQISFAPIIMHDNLQKSMPYQEASQYIENKQQVQMLIIKKYIDYFVYYWIESDQQGLGIIFSEFFLADINQTPQQIQVCPRLSFKQHCHKLKTKYLWDLTQEIFRQLEINDKQKFIYCYFFIQMGLVQPQQGFLKIDYISYDYVNLMTVLNKFKQKCDMIPELYFLDYSKIFYIYLNGLTQLLVDQTQQKVDQDNDNLNDSKRNNQNIKENTETSRVQNRANLNVVRQLIKKGQYKNNPLSVIINKMSLITAETQKNLNKNLREYKYANYITATKKQINTSKKQRLKNKKSQKNQAVIESQDKSSTRFEQKKVQQKLIMSFDQFKKMKNRIKNDKSLTVLPNQLDVTERVIVQQIFNKNNDQNTHKFNGERKQIPGLREIIEASIKQIQYKQKKQQDKVEPKQQIKQKIQQRKPVLLKKTTFKQAQIALNKQQYNDEQVLVEAIKNESYSVINNWSSDAILIQLSKIYDREDITFASVMKMLQELYVGDHTKIDVLWIAQPQQLKVSNQVLKNIFTIEYLKHQFGTYEEYEVDILAKIYMNVQHLKVQQIQQLSVYICDITKFAFKRGSKNIWLQMLVNTAITKQAEYKRPKQQKIQRLDSLFKLLGPQTLNKKRQNIMQLFIDEGQVDILPELVQKIDRNINV